MGLLLVMTLALSSCVQPRKMPPCPNIYALGTARTIDVYKDQRGRDAKDIDFHARLDDWQGSCQFTPREDTADADLDVKIDMTIGFTVTRGPANRSGTAAMTYFVAIPVYYPNPAGKATFPLSITFPPGVDTVHVSDGPISMTIPMKTTDVIDSYTIYLGFQETAEQLERNRRGN
jgi:hypothetical protein